MALSVPTPTGVLDGVALFNWDGTAWQPSGSAMPDVATPTGVLDGVAGFAWSGTAWAPTGLAMPSVATPSGVLEGVALYTWDGTQWQPNGGGATSTPTPSGVLKGVAAFAWDGTAWQPAAHARPSVRTPYGVLRGVAPYNWSGSAWVPGSAAPSGEVIVSTTGPVSLTGTTSRTNMVALRIPANSIGKNGAVEVKALWSYTNSSNAKTVETRLSPTPDTGGSFAGGNLQVTTTATAQTLAIIRNNNATNSQIMWPANPAAPFGSATAANLTAAIDTTVDAYVCLNATLAVGTETITLQRATAVVFYAP